MCVYTGLHNGHTLLGGDYTTVHLFEDREDRDLLLPASNLIEIDGYVPHEVTAVVIVLEYVFKSISDTFKAVPTIPTLNSTLQNGQLVTSITVGAAVYVPYDGNKLVLHNHSTHPDEGGNHDPADLSIQLDLRVDDVCTLVAIKPVYLDMPEKPGALSTLAMTKRSSLVADNLILDAKQSKSDSKSNDNNTNNNDILKNKGRAVTILSSIVNFESEESYYSTAYTVAFDLKVIDLIKGIECIHGEVIDDLTPAPVTRLGTTMIGTAYLDLTEEEKSFSRTIMSPTSPSAMTKRFKTSQYDRSHLLGYDNEEDGMRSQISDPLVEGDELLNSLRLDPEYYEDRLRPKTRVRKGAYDTISELGSDFSVGSEAESRFRLPRKMQGLLGQAIKVKLASDYRRGPVNDDDMLYERRPQVPGAMRATAHSITSYAEPKQQAAHTSYHTVPPQQVHTRELSRAARARLGRHGLDNAIFDPSYDRQRTQGQLARTSGTLVEAYQQKLTHIYSQKHTHDFAAIASNIPALVASEVDERFLLHEITLQFAGFVPLTSKTLQQQSASLPQSAVKPPKAVYFTYQFYTCKPTRTEVMKLLPGDNDQSHILVRDIAHSRDEIPLALRYSIDCTGPAVSDTGCNMSPDVLYEAKEFAEYLAVSSLFVEVWDAESLLLMVSIYTHV